jgi:hypothetical protein
MFAEDTKLWLIFISAVSILMISFTLFLAFQAYKNKEDTKKLENQINKNNIMISQFNKKINFINKEKTLYTNIMINNQLLKDGVKNLLDLIPDPITVTNVQIKKNSLVIYGITPTKDVYNLLLIPPLKAIFNQTHTNFYQMSNGWYRFESINSLKEEE